MNKYLRAPPAINCSNLIETYGDAGLERLAVMEMLYAGEIQKELGSSWGLQIDARVPHSGASTCYCEHLYEETGGDLASVPQTWDF